MHEKEMKTIETKERSLVKRIAVLHYRRNRSWRRAQYARVRGSWIAGA